MKKGIFIIMVGVIIGTSGVIFHLQGQSVVGPESSFMYSNPDWIAFGIQIAITGFIIIISGVIISIMKKG